MQELMLLNPRHRRKGRRARRNPYAYNPKRKTTRARGLSLGSVQNELKDVASLVIGGGIGYAATEYLPAVAQQTSGLGKVAVQALTTAAGTVVLNKFAGAEMAKGFGLLAAISTAKTLGIILYKEAKKSGFLGDMGAEISDEYFAGLGAQVSDDFMAEYAIPPVVTAPPMVSVGDYEEEYY